MNATRRHIEEAKDCLLAARDALADEITAYPTPISGCDDQFSQLLRDREIIHRALSALESDVFVATPHRLTPPLSIRQRRTP